MALGILCYSLMMGQSPQLTAYLAEAGCEATPAELVSSFAWGRLRREDIVVDEVFLATLL